MKNVDAVRGIYAASSLEVLTGFSSPEDLEIACVEAA